MFKFVVLITCLLAVSAQNRKQPSDFIFPDSGSHESDLISHGRHRSKGQDDEYSGNGPKISDDESESSGNGPKGPSDDELRISESSGDGPDNNSKESKSIGDGKIKDIQSTTRNIERTTVLPREKSTETTEVLEVTSDGEMFFATDSEVDEDNMEKKQISFISGSGKTDGGVLTFLVATALLAANFQI